MADYDYAKLWASRDLNLMAQDRIRDSIQQQGKAFPCHVTKVSGAMLTVNIDVNDPNRSYPQIVVPKAESAWVRMPTQVGDLGMLVPADAYLTYVDGLSKQIPDGTTPANLSALVFVPVSSSLSPPANDTQVILTGPNGLLAQTGDGKVSLSLTESGLVVTVNGQTMTFSGSALSVSSTLKVSGDATIDGVDFMQHVHTGVQSGSSTTGPVS